MAWGSGQLLGGWLFNRAGHAQCFPRHRKGWEREGGSRAGSIFLSFHPYTWKGQTRRYLFIRKNRLSSSLETLQVHIFNVAITQKKLRVPSSAVQLVIWALDICLQTNFTRKKVRIAFFFSFWNEKWFIIIIIIIIILQTWFEPWWLSSSSKKCFSWLHPAKKKREKSYPVFYN